MYSREKVELFLLATEDGMGPTAAAEFAGVTVSAAKKWATGHLPRSYTGGGCRIVARKPPRKEASLGPDKSIYAPPATGPLAGLNEDQIENLLLRAVLADLKAEGWDPASISNRSKCELGERLRRATALPLRSITGFLRISKSSYEYWRPRVAAPRDRDADIRDRVVRIFREGSGCWGYRTVWARLRREGVRASEKRVARVMREEGLEVVYNKRRARGYSSYAGEVSKAPENLVNRNFHADEPNRLWLTDITEFRLPGGEKVYLSPVIDCFDGMPVAWSIGLHPDKRLANSSLLKACAARPAGGRTTIHSDRGGHYRWPEWIGICEENGLVRSMSAKPSQPGQLGLRGLLRAPQERVLPLQGLGGRDGRGVHGEARGLPRVLSGWAHQEIPRVAEPDGVPQDAWIRLGAVQEIVRTPLCSMSIRFFLRISPRIGKTHSGKTTPKQLVSAHKLIHLLR